MGNGENILVIEDEPDIADLLQFNLELSGYNVRVADNGATGLDAVHADRPDLVVLDVMMPVLDGWSVLRELREDDELQDVPVVLVTALSEERDVIRGHLDGAIEYVTKPFEMRELLASVQRALTEPDDAVRRDRRQRVRRFLQRLAELDSGRTADGSIRFSKLEQRPAAHVTDDTASAVDRERMGRLTDNQRYVAGQLAAGRAVRDLAEELDVSRSNVYATRKRIARKLGVTPDEVSDEVRRLSE